VDQRSGWLGVIASELYIATGKSSYLSLATTIGNAFKARLQPNKTGWIWDNGTIPIGSQKLSSLNPSPNDVGNQEGVPDTNGANAAVSMVVLEHEAGIVFSLSDVQRTASTLSDIMWNNASPPVVSNYIDGSNQPFTFQYGPGGNSFVWGWSLLAPYSQTVQSFMSDLAIDADENPKTNETTYVNSLYYSLIAIFGNLVRFNMVFLYSISPAGVPVVAAPSSLVAYVGSPFSYQISATNSPMSYAVSGLPAGLTVNTSTGLISGTPTTPQTVTVTASATNSAGTSSQVAFTLIVNPAIPSVSAIVSAAGNQSALAPGALATIYGANFTAASAVFNNGPSTQNTNAGSNFGTVSGHKVAIGFNFVVPTASDFVFIGGTLTASVSIPGPVTIALYADSGSGPGIPIESMTANVTAGGPATISFNSALFPILSAGIQYWLVVSASSGSVSQGLWLVPDASDLGVKAVSQDGAPWVTATGTRGAFAINGYQKAAADAPERGDVERW